MKNFQELKEVVFPYGNHWFYIPSLVWIVATSVFYITLPALLFSARSQYEQNTGIIVDLHSAMIQFSSDLFLLSLMLIRILIVFLIVSAIFDGIEDYKIRQRQRGYL